MALPRDFRQQEPAEGAPATEITEVRIAVDGENIYVAVMAFDREPDRVVSRILRRDQILENDHNGFQFAGDDAVAILFDTFHDSRSAFVFATNSNGAEFEALIRLNFIHRPGSDLFIVLTERRGVEDELWHLSNRGLVAKLTYLARL